MQNNHTNHKTLPVMQNDRQDTQTATKKGKKHQERLKKIKTHEEQRKQINNSHLKPPCKA